MRDEPEEVLRRAEATQCFIKWAIAYAVIAWLFMQIVTQVFPFLEIPNWAIRLVIMRWRMDSQHHPRCAATTHLYRSMESENVCEHKTTQSA
jgi:hypothetical protein